MRFALRVALGRGRLARNAALALGDTLILAFSHKVRRDPLTAILYLTSGSGLRSSTPHPLAVAIFAKKTNFETYPCKFMKGEGIR